MEKNSRKFALPDDAQLIRSLVAAIPDDWGWLDGCLEAPADKIADGTALDSTGLLFDRLNEKVVTSRTPQGLETRRQPDYFALFVEDKLPGFVSFHEAGYEDRIRLTLKKAKSLADGFLMKGYRGSLNFYRDCRHNRKYSNSASVSIFCGDKENDIGRDETPFVQVSWDEEYHGSESHVASILAICTKFELKPL